MLRRVSIAVLLLLAPRMGRAGEILDQLAATVNGQVVLASDIDEELRYEYFSAKRPLTDISPVDEKDALNRLIDQQLVREQMHSADFKAVDAEAVEKAFETFKSDYGSSESWIAALASYGITEVAVRSHIETELNQLRLIDLRLRPSIQVDAESVRNYYEQKVLPKLPPGQHPSLQDSTPAIRELLIQQEMNASLDSWLQALRAGAKIRIFAQLTGDQHK
jgi:peptidyl-prolyl cis-trans isomerase SurA